MVLVQQGLQDAIVNEVRGIFEKVKCKDIWAVVI